MVKSWAPGVVIACTELDKQSFNTLVFIKGEEGNTDTVTTDGRSLYAVTKTIEQKYPNLSELFSLNNWFKDVQKIYDDFDYAQFQYLVLRAPTDENERKASNNGPLYLEGGNHRSLALAIKINLEGYEFKSVKAVILLQPPTQL